MDLKVYCELFFVKFAKGWTVMAVFIQYRKCRFALIRIVNTRCEDEFSSIVPAGNNIDRFIGLRMNADVICWVSSESRSILLVEVEVAPQQSRFSFKPVVSMVTWIWRTVSRLRKVLQFIDDVDLLIHWLSFLEDLPEWIIDILTGLLFFG